MTTKQYILARCTMRKEAGIPFLEPLFKYVAGTSADLTKETIKAAATSAAVTLPVSALGLAFLLAKANSPKAVADNAHEYATNAMEKETLAQTIRDMESLKAADKLNARKRKPHDRFL